MSKEIKPSLEYLKQLTKGREKIRQLMLGQEPQTQSELRFVESKIIDKIREVKTALSMEV